jgi:hybrid cluster-associated redox disulfide protein
MEAKKIAKKNTHAKAQTKAKITKEMTLGELVIKHPDAVNVMYKYGMHCIGCHMAAYETIEQGASAHGMDKKAIGRMLKEMNES